MLSGMLIVVNNVYGPFLGLMGGPRRCDTMAYGWAKKVWYCGIWVGQESMVPWYMGGLRKCGTIAYGWADEV